MVYQNGRVFQDVLNFEVVELTWSFIKGVEDNIYFGAGCQRFAHFQELAEDFILVLEMEILIHHEFCGLADSAP